MHGMYIFAIVNTIEWDTESTLNSNLKMDTHGI